MLLNHDQWRGRHLSLPSLQTSTPNQRLRYPVVKESDPGRHAMSSSPIPLKTRRVGERCTLNLSRALTSSRWWSGVVRRGGASAGVVLVT
ncbi:hypothetical protein TNCV_2015191 [Trichonephila clavipes]|nr:hypothetical protein TNCV_2015191 [Trichonephila clavipes]